MSENKSDSLKSFVRTHLSDYFKNLEGAHPADLYALVLKEVEAPLFEMVMTHVSQNQSLAAKMLGLSRGTLRKKLEAYRLL